MQQLESIPVCQIRPTGLLLYDLTLNHHPGRIHQREKEASTQANQKGKSQDHLTEKAAYSGDMSPGSIRRLKRSIQTLVAIAEPKEAPRLKGTGTFTFKLNFITLTLPAPQDNITDKYLKKECLNPFIKELQRKHGLRSYIWKAEKQQNGNLHFHLTTDTYLHFNTVRSTWNYHLQKTGLIEKFRAKYGHSNPPTEQVKAVQKVQNLCAYLVKYMAKQNKDGLKIDGKMWDCSLNLKQKIKCEMEVDSETHEWITETINQYPNQLIQGERFLFIYLPEALFKQVITSKYRDMYEEWILKIRNWKPPDRKKQLVRLDQPNPRKFSI